MANDLTVNDTILDLADELLRLQDFDSVRNMDVLKVKLLLKFTLCAT